MKEIKSLVNSKKIQTCILIDKDNKISWCVYHDDDAAERLTFTKNLTDIENISIIEIEEHLNKYGLK
jgi:hypothetical protein